MKKKKIIGIIIVLTIIAILSIAIINYFYQNEQNNIEEYNTISSEVGNNLYENLLVNNNIQSNYNSDEYYTEFSYYYLTVMDSSYSDLYSNSSSYDYNNILKEVSYTRYVYQNDSWILAENKSDSPFFTQTGNGTIVNSERYYIPIYELEEGKNKIVVTETTNGNTTKEKEFIINRTSSEYDNMYLVNNINTSDTLSLNTYQDVIDVNINDYNDILLTGSFYSNYDIENITWTRYRHKNNSDEWEVMSKSESNEVYYQPEGNANIYGNYWAIDILMVDSEGEKVEITATDSSNETITKTVFINNTSSAINYNPENSSYDDKNIIDDNGIKFINNEVLITFNNNVKTSRCEEIISEIQGEIISSIDIMKHYEVKINNEFNTYAEIQHYCAELEATYDEITHVGINMLMEIESDIED